MAKTTNIQNNLRVHVVNMFDEILQHNNNMACMKIPLMTLTMILGKAAARAAELGDEEMIGYFCRLALYDFSNPSLPEEYDAERTKKYINKTK